MGINFIELAYSKLMTIPVSYMDWKDLSASAFMGLGAIIIEPLFQSHPAIIIFNFAYEIFNPRWMAYAPTSWVINPSAGLGIPG